jgi:hypothetical protein
MRGFPFFHLAIPLTSVPRISMGVLTAAILASSSVRADVINWTYDWSRSPVVVAADKDGTGGISLTVNPQASAQGNSDIVAASLSTFSDAPRTAPDTFTNKGYSLTLQLGDVPSGKQGSLTFAGMFNGSLSAFDANVTNQFSGPTTQKLTLANDIYTVTIGPYAPPGLPGSKTFGSVGAHVSVVNDQIGNGGSQGGPTGSPHMPHDAPEPSALVLLGTGMISAGAGWWRRSNRVLPS